MYNNYPRSTDAWDAIEYEAKPALKKLEDAASDVESAMEAMADQIDTLQGERDEWQEEAERLQEETENLQAKVDCIDPIKTIELMNQVETAGAALIKFAVDTRMKIRKAYDLEESPAPGGDGADSDGDSQGADNSGNGEATPGITRPQIP